MIIHGIFQSTASPEGKNAFHTHIHNMEPVHHYRY